MNSVSKMKSTYFEVRDLEAFKKELGTVEFDGLKVEEETVPGKIMLYGPADPTGWKDVLDEDGDAVDDEAVNLFELVQPHLPVGEKVLFEMQSSEGYRSMYSYAVLLTCEHSFEVNAADAVLELAFTKGLLTRTQVNAFGKSL